MSPKEFKGEKREKSPTPTEFTFHYQKSSLHRTVRIDGAYGVIGPHGDLSITLYNERFPIPRAIVQQVSPSGEVLPKIVQIEGKDGMVRELEVTMSINPTAAVNLAKFLLEKAAEAQEQLRAIGEATLEEND
jgi:hypothetical protein